MFLVPAVHVELTDTVDAQFLLLELNLVGIGCEFGGERANVIWEGGGEEDDLNGLAARQTTMIPRV